MSKDTDIFEVKFFDKDIHPDSIRVADLARFLTALDSSFASIVERMNPGLTADGTGLSLVGVRPGCAALDLSLNKPAINEPAFDYMMESIRSGALERLPNKARDFVEATKFFNAKYNCKTEFRRSKSDKTPAAVIYLPKAIRVPETGTIRGETDIYAVVVRVGGTKKPKVGLKLDSGETFEADASKEMVKRLGRRMYERVGLQGEATWETPSNTLIEFNIMSELPYRGEGLSKAFTELRETFGECFADIADIDEFVSKQRED